MHAFNKHLELARGQAYRNIDEGDAGAVIAIGLQLIDQRVLTPVADHEAYPQQEEGKQEDKGCWFGVPSPHSVHERIAGDFGEEGSDAEVVLLALDEVQWQLEPDKEHEASNVVEEVADVIALVANGRR